MRNISVGYQLSVTTYEGDGDNKKSVTISGLTKEEVNFFIDLAKQFYDVNSYGESGIGNQSNDNHILYKLVQEVLSRNPNISEDWKDENFWHEDVIYENLCELILGIPNDGMWGNFCRALYNLEVYYVPTEIINVSNEFLEY